MFDNLEKSLNILKPSEIQKEKVNESSPYKDGMKLHESLEQATFIDAPPEPVLCEKCKKDMKECVCKAEEGKVVDPTQPYTEKSQQDLVETAIKKLTEMAKKMNEDVQVPENKKYFGSKGNESFYAEELKDDDGNLLGINIYNTTDEVVLNTSDKGYSLDNKPLLLQSMVNDLALDSVSFQYLMDLGILQQEPQPEEVAPAEPNKEEKPAEEPKPEEVKPEEPKEEKPAEETPAEIKSEEPKEEEPEEAKKKDGDDKSDSEKAVLKDLNKKNAEKDDKQEEGKVADVNADLDKIKNDLLEKHGLK